MALNETQRINLLNLDLEFGTGIFPNNTRVHSIDQPTVIIGLGGLGCSTVNQLKRQIMKRVNRDYNTIRFLAIDSDERDLRQHDALSPGEETVCLFDLSIPALAAAPWAVPPHIKAWMNTEYRPQLNGQGCGAIRQNGRFSLAVPAVYDRVRSKLRDVICSARDVAPGGGVNVILIAGISGGTGSGTFIDMAYLVQDVLLCDIGMAKSCFDIRAYLYMPDVQYAIPGVCRPALDRNAYAALKELDYYMNIQKSGGVYKWPFAEGSVKNSRYQVFDFCTLVSGTTNAGIGNNTRVVAINAAVESIMAIVSKAEFISDGLPRPLYSSLLDCVGHAVNVWSADNINSPLFPGSANYCYSVLGFGSAKVPVDAIMSYMAHEMYKKMLDELSDTKDLTANLISNIMNTTGVGDVETIIRAVKDAAGYTYAPCELPRGGDIRRLRGTYTQWKIAAYDHYKSFKQQQQFHAAIDYVTENIIRALDNKLELVFDECGPYFAVRAITAKKADCGVEGILEKIHSLRVEMSQIIEDRIFSGIIPAQIEAKVDAGATDIGGLFGVSNYERDAFMAKARQKMEMYTIELDVMEAMIEKLKFVSENIIEKNNKVFDVYTDVFDYIKDILAKNSDSVLWNMNGPCDNIFNAVDIDVMHGNGQKLKRCVDSFLTEPFVEDFKCNFIAMLRDRNNRPAFTDQIDEFDAALCVQNIFTTLLGNYYQEALERFLITYYSNNPQMSDNNYLDAVMMNQVQKDAELTNAATAICNELSNRVRPLCGLTTSLNTFTPPQRYLVVPKNLVPIFGNVAPGIIGPCIVVCGKEHAFSFDYIAHHPGIPLYAISGMEAMDAAYSEAVEREDRWLHLNENSEDFVGLPAPFVSEMWERSGYESSVELRNLDKVKRVVDRLEELGYLKYDGDVGKSNLRVEGYFEIQFSEEEVETMRELLATVRNENKPYAEKIGDFLTRVNAEITTLPVSMLCDFGLRSTYDNRYIIVRKNPTLFKKLQSFLQVIESFIGAR
ncbi:MAG: hypothetical protein IJP38_07195 [Oscillospiraceae bacterium]|nr:hypothetical protein [Oscillospiraceae bacterium]